VIRPMVPDALIVIRGSRDSSRTSSGLVVVSNRRNVRHHPLLRFGAAPVDVTVCHSYCGDRRTADASGLVGEFIAPRARPGQRRTEHVAAREVEN
jgi:hypothetical protein